jgi:hypothetical protein
VQFGEKVLIVAGSAPCLQRELRAALERFPGADIAAVNAAGCRIRQRIRWWVSYHPECFAGWAARRRGNHDYQQIEPDDFAHPPRLSGTSTLLAAAWGLEAGYRHVHVVGAPMSLWNYRRYLDAWRDQAYGNDGRITAESGALAAVLAEKRAAALAAERETDGQDEEDWCDEN